MGPRGQRLVVVFLVLLSFGCFEITANELVSAQEAEHVAEAVAAARAAGNLQGALESLREYLVRSRVVVVAWAVDMHTGWSTLARQLITHLHRDRGRPCLTTQGVESNFRQITTLPAEQDALRECQKLDVVAAELKALALVLGTPTKPLVLSGVPVMHALGDKWFLDGAESRICGTPCVALLFAEMTTFDDAGRAMAERFDFIAVGSTWIQTMVRSFAMHRDVRLLPQGTHTAVFQPSAAREFERLKGRFVVFSGGKLELRKAQDIVLVAFKAFYKKHPDAILVAAWQNQYVKAAEQIHLMGKAPVPVRIHPLTRMLRVRDWILDHGLPDEAFAAIGFASQAEVASVQCRADVAVYTSRCEAGTNLFAMQSVACATPTVLSNNTGHRDILGPAVAAGLRHTIALNDQVPIHTPENITIGWGESDVEEVVRKLEWVYKHRSKAKAIGARGRALMLDKWTVEARTEAMIDALLPA